MAAVTLAARALHGARLGQTVETRRRHTVGAGGGHGVGVAAGPGRPARARSPDRAGPGAHDRAGTRSDRQCADAQRKRDAISSHSHFRNDTPARPLSPPRHVNILSLAESRSEKYTGVSPQYASREKEISDETYVWEGRLV